MRDVVHAHLMAGWLAMSTLSQRSSVRTTSMLNSRIIERVSATREAKKDRNVSPLLEFPRPAVRRTMSRIKSWLVINPKV